MDNLKDILRRRQWMKWGCQSLKESEKINIMLHTVSYDSLILQPQALSRVTCFQYITINNE